MMAQAFWPWQNRDLCGSHTDSSVGMERLLGRVRDYFWSGREDSNLRPLGPKPSALPGCATPRNVSQRKKRRPAILASLQRSGQGSKKLGCINQSPRSVADLVLDLGFQLRESLIISIRSEYRIEAESARAFREISNFPFAYPAGNMEEVTFFISDRNRTTEPCASMRR